MCICLNVDKWHTITKNVNLLASSVALTINSRDMLKSNDKHETAEIKKSLVKFH